MCCHPRVLGFLVVVIGFCSVGFPESHESGLFALAHLGASLLPLLIVGQIGEV
jgi:hypothetical protein